MTAPTPFPDAMPPFPEPTPKVLLNVSYDHYRMSDGADLYVTVHGRPWLPQLHPSSWYEPDWFRRSREKLQGTSRVYRVRTKPLSGRSKDLVVKWCRVGEDVPMDTFTLNKFIEAEFNSPYEEFSLLMEMRRVAPPGLVRTHKPLAIYVPAKRFELWQTGRSPSKMAQKKAKFRDVELDLHRQYILIYEWIKGIPATSPEAAALAAIPQPPDNPTVTQSNDSTDQPSNDPTVQRSNGPTPSPPPDDPEPFTERMLKRSVADLWQAGFRVLDVKPQHVIVRPDPHGNGLLRDRTGGIAYALVDFELLARTPEHEKRVLQTRRQNYLERQRDRFAPPVAFPPHLRPVRLFGVDYVHGDCGSTNGKLWVVGHDPNLFDYFQPERWRRTPRTPLSDSARVYRTATKDGIQLVWKISHVGDVPDPAETSPALAARGYNSPFEEFSFALRLADAGCPATYPRAVYMLGHKSTLPPETLDPRRYDTHDLFREPDGSPALRKDRVYIVIWGFWNGLDEVLATSDSPSGRCEGIHPLEAVRRGLVPGSALPALMSKTANLLASAGFTDTLPRPGHFLLTLLPDGTLARDPDDTPAIRVCTFETLRPLA